ncbi:hypothetical protein H0H92_006111, partial [Tricholoma furcatifolium]
VYAPIPPKKTVDGGLERESMRMPSSSSTTPESESTTPTAELRKEMREVRLTHPVHTTAHAAHAAHPVVHPVLVLAQVVPLSPAWIR